MLGITREDIVKKSSTINLTKKRNSIMKTLSQLLQNSKVGNVERKCYAISEMVFSKNVGDPLLKKLDYKLM